MKQAVKTLFNLLFAAMTFPMALACGFGRFPGAFTFFAQLCALAPGLPGDYLRITFYWQTLDKCSVNSRISQGSFFVNPQVHLGERVYIGANCILGPCRIGERTLIASSVQIMPGRRQHPRRADGTLETDTQSSPISVGHDCWIGASAIVMENVEPNSTVAAGAIVTRPVTSGMTVAGNPAPSDPTPKRLGISMAITPASQPVPVLFIIHSLGHGGMERQVTMLAKNLDHKRFQPHVAAVVEGFRAEELRREGIPVIAIPIRSFLDPGPIAISRELRKYIRLHGIRLVHLFDAGLSLIALMSTRPGRNVRLLTSQRFYMHLAKPSHRKMLIAAHWLSDGIVVNSEDTRRHLHEDYRFPLSRIDVCYNGIDGNVFHPEPRRRLSQLEDAELVIGCVCVLRPEKNLEILIRAFAKSRASTTLRTKLLIMGSGPEEGKLKALVEQLGIEEFCCFLPSAADVTAAMRSIDIFVHPSLTESLPNGVMEAMACGCCVISSRVGGCPELIEDGVHGFLVAPDDLHGLTAKLTATIASPEMREKMASAAAHRIATEFSVPASVHRMEDIYEQRLK